MFGRENGSVEENQNDDKPMKPLRFDRLVAQFTTSTIPLENALPASNHATSFIFTVRRYGKSQL